MIQITLRNEGVKTEARAYGTAGIFEIDKTVKRRNGARALEAIISELRKEGHVGVPWVCEGGLKGTT